MWCEEWKFSVEKSGEYEDEERKKGNGTMKIPGWEEIVEKCEELIWMATVRFTFVSYLVGGTDFWRNRSFMLLRVDPGIRMSSWTFSCTFRFRIARHSSRIGVLTTLCEQDARIDISALPTVDSRGHLAASPTVHPSFPFPSDGGLLDFTRSVRSRSSFALHSTGLTT